jgi:hypothetical protein
MGIWRRSSSPSSPTSLHWPSMTLPSMCEQFPRCRWGDGRDWMRLFM